MRRYKNTTVAVFCFFIAIVSLVLGYLNFYCTIDDVIEENKSQMSKILCSKVSDELVNERLFQSFDVVRTITASTMLSEVLNGKDDAVIGEKLYQYMSRLKEHFDFSNITIARASDRKLFTADGNSMNLDPNDQISGAWYSRLLNSKQDIRLEMGQDAFHDNNINVFTNAKLYDPKTNELQGVVSVGFKLSKIREDIFSTEKLYGVKIDFVNSEGIIIMAGDDESVGGLYPLFRDESLKKDFLRKTPFYFRNLEGYGSCTSSYIPEIDLHIIVSDDNAITGPASNIILKNAAWLAVFFAIIFIMIILFVKRDAILGRIVDSDMTTGLYNGKFLKKYVKKFAGNLITPELYVVCFDLPYLKVINAKYGAEGEKECIVGLGKLIFSILSPFGKCFRTKGGEFKCIIEIDESNFKEIMGKIRNEIENWKGRIVPNLSVKIGITNAYENEGKTLEELVNAADYNVYHNDDGVHNKE